MYNAFAYDEKDNCLWINREYLELLEWSIRIRLYQMSFLVIRDVCKDIGDCQRLVKIFMKFW